VEEGEEGERCRHRVLVQGRCHLQLEPGPILCSRGLQRVMPSFEGLVGRARPSTTVGEILTRYPF
jgi:hypothetical protein